MLDVCFGASECGMLKYALRKSHYGVTYSFCGLEFGKIDEENFNESRKKWIDFSFTICSPKERAKILKEEVSRFNEIIETAKKGEILRIWCATTPCASTLAKAVIAALSQLPKGAVKTITCDRGSEFANWREIESALNCQMYFADPYCAWQKGTNENLNGLLREFYPKGHNLSRVSPKTLKKNLALINARPKKILNFQKPVDLFELFLKKCCT